MPFIVEAYGRLSVDEENLLKEQSVDAENLLKELPDVAASVGKCDPEGHLHWIWKEISLSLFRGNMK